MDPVATVHMTAGGLPELATALREACRQPGVAAVLAQLGGRVLDPDGDGGDGEAAVRVAAALRRAGLPSVVAVTGPVSGAGLAALLCFDVSVCHPDATLTAGDPATGAGLAGDLPALLVRQLGPARARALVLTGRQLTAAQAHADGLVSEVDDDCDRRAAELAAGWAAAPGAGLLRRALAAAERLDPAESREFAQHLAALLPNPGHR